MQLIYLTMLAALLASPLSAQTAKSWTVMHYAAGSNSSEIDLLSDIAEMQVGKKSDDYHVVLLVDRIEGHSNDSTTLDGNFNDTRLYSIHPQRYQRLDGGEYLAQISTTTRAELNMGDAETLRNFIRYCKKHFPADHYMLVLRSHGSGGSMCPDVEEAETDRLYPAEISKVLTSDESVDVLGLDVCSMAGLENLYQWRPESETFSADYVVASAPLSGAWAYDHILERFKSDLSPIELGAVVYEEILENQGWASWALMDNHVISELKSQIDESSRLLAKEERSEILQCMSSSLGYHHNTANDEQVGKMTFPYVDAFDFWSNIAEAKTLSNACRASATRVCELLDQLVVRSFYGKGYLPETTAFETNKGGVYQIIPQGLSIYEPTGRTYWAHTNWFHPDDTSATPNSYGQYDWCQDGAIRGNQHVDNFYELLDFLFDYDNGKEGGVNGYQW